MRTCKHSTDCHQNEVCNDKKQCVCDYGYKLDSKGHCMENNECDCLEVRNINLKQINFYQAKKFKI